MDVIARTLAAVPDYEAFLTVDELDASSRELAARYPDLVELSVIGHSRAGHPIQQLKIGSGSRRVLMFGCPHPNEPIGAMMLEFLSRRLCEDEQLRRDFDYTWYLIKCIDIDGTRLNEGWFKGPFSPANYIRDFYRPAMPQQVEWTFPLEYKSYTFAQPLPETEALMQAIETARPDVIVSLHNAGFGGVFYYVTEELPDALADKLRALATERGLPLWEGEPEVPFAHLYSSGIYRMPTTKDMYEFHASMQPDTDPATVLTHGACSHEYAERFASPITIVPEMPYFYDRRVGDVTPTATRRRDAVLQAMERDESLLDVLAAQYERVRPHLQVATPFEDAVDDFLQNAVRSAPGRRRWAETSPALDRSATVAELFDSELQMLFYRLLYFALFRRMVAAQPAHPELTAADAVVKAELDRWSDHLEQNLNYSVVPIRDLVSVQLGAALLTMQHRQQQR